MGLMDKVKEGVKDNKFLRAYHNQGIVASHCFPSGTVLYFEENEGDPAMEFIYPNGERYVVTYDKVKSADVMVMGVIGLSNDGKTKYYGTKYRLELEDGKTAIVTVNMDDNYKVEHVLL